MTGTLGDGPDPVADRGGRRRRRSALTGGTATFANKNVGTGKTVTLTGASLTGADAGNYSAELGRDDDANITAKSITGNFTAANKVYDGEYLGDRLDPVADRGGRRRRRQP